MLHTVEGGGDLKLVWTKTKIGSKRYNRKMNIIYIVYFKKEWL